MIDWLLWALVKGLSALLCRLPAAVAIWLGARMGELAYWMRSTRTQVGVRNVRAAFDGELSVAQTHRIVRASFAELGAGVFEMLRLPVIDRAYVDRYVTFEGREHFDRALASGRPVVALTGHYGNWEFTAITGALLGYPIVVLARVQQKLPRLYQFLVSFREAKGCRIVHQGGAMKELLAALDRRKVVGIVGDQPDRYGMWVQFFGRPSLFATGPYELAYTSNALIVPFYIRRLRGPFHRLIFEPAIDLARERGDKKAAIRAGMVYFAQTLTRHIREEPSQWLWIHRRWKHTPARRVLVLSDGKVGHLKQSLAVVEALRQRSPDLSSHIVEIHYRSRVTRLVGLLWSWWMPARWGAATCLKRVLTPESARELLTRYADVIVSCGAATVPANRLWATDSRAESVVVE